MKKITLLLAAAMVAATSWAQNPTITTEWELSAATSTLPDWIGTGGTVRGMGFGTFESNKVLVIPTRTPVLAFKVVNASNGIVLGDLNVTGVTGGDVTVSDAAITADGNVLAANVTVGSATAQKVFKVYRWVNSTDAPTVAISYTYTGDLNRYGDHFSVTGRISDGTAKVYAASTVLNSGVASVISFSMISDGNGGFVFNQTPTVVSAAVTATGSYASIDFLPDGKFLWKSNAQQARKYNADGSYANDVSLSSVFASGGASLRYLKTKTALESTNPDTMYVAYFRFGSGQERANILKLPNGVLANAIVTNTTPALGTNGNGGGSGKVELEVTGTNNDYIYVLSTNNGIGKYKITWPSVPTATKNTSNEFSLVKSGQQLMVENVIPRSMIIYNVAGQKLQAVANSNTISVEGLKGIHIVKMNVNGKTHTQKVVL